MPELASPNPNDPTPFRVEVGGHVFRARSVSIDPAPLLATAGGRPQRTARARPIHARRHAGRNDPCPCGSGLKYKRCCLRRPD